MSRFEASDSYVKRADNKFSQLKTTVNRYLADDILLTQERNTYGAKFFAEIRRPMGDDIGFEVIEAVDLLRAALDKMIADIVHSNGMSTSQVAFPFGGMNNVFPSKRDDRIKEKLTAEQWALVLDQKPYPGGNDMLWGVNNIANRKKHGLGIVRIGPNFDMTSLRRGKHRFYTPGPMEGTIRMAGQIPINQAGKFEVLEFQHIEGHIEFKKPFQIIFSDIDPVAGKNVLVILNQQIRLIKRILHLFSHLV